jgi:hypothetical protein
MKIRKIKQVLLGVGTSKRERESREDKGGQIGLTYFVYMYENRTINSVETVLIRERGDEGE